MSKELREKYKKYWKSLKTKKQNKDSNIKRSLTAKKQYKNRRLSLGFCIIKGENHPNWNGGSSFGKYSPEFNEKKKISIRVRDDFICQECNQNEEELGYKLSIHHIDYDKKNNDSDNLISLCKSCHAQTNFNRNDWQSYFQNKLIGGKLL